MTLCAPVCCFGFLMSRSALDADQIARVERALAVVAAEIEAAGGRIPFDRYMELVLYAPGAGYYVNGAHKFGRKGDFVTAPEISPLFGAALAHQAAEILERTGGSLLEFGAGSGAMAGDILARLAELDRLPDRYQILELSAELRARQAENLRRRVPELIDRVEWLDRLPDAGWRGLVLANELLDAMPVSRFRVGDVGWEEQQVELHRGAPAPVWDTPVTPGLVQRLEAIESRLGAFPRGYQSEVNLRLAPWLRAVAGFVARGAILLIDYGYTEREYYHPERDQGTLICHFRHRTHDDPFALPGLQDVTASVDFSAVAEAGVAAGLELAGYTTQAQFLLGCGLDRLLAEPPAMAAGEHIDRLQGVKQLVLPSAMGERFKVIAFTRGLDGSLSGFEMRDLRASL